MFLSDAKIGIRVVRSKGDYVVGRTGSIIDIDEKSGRCQIDWDGSPKTWVAIDSIELENIPYEIIEQPLNKRTGRYPYPKYVRK